MGLEINRNPDFDSSLAHSLFDELGPDRSAQPTAVSMDSSAGHRHLSRTRLQAIYLGRHRYLGWPPQIRGL